MLFHLLAFILAWEVLAHQSSLTSSGDKVAWPALSVPVNISTNTSDLSPTSSRNIIQNSINQWNAASSFKFSGSGGANSISFTSDFSEYGPGVVGVTEVTFNSAGVIQKAAILLNDDFNFQSTPGFYGGSDVYLGDVVSHELGHMMGLSHSEVLESSMFYSSFTGQSSIAYDDRAAARAKYSSGFGSISGHVRGGNNVGVLGVHVQAVSRNSGEVVGAFSQEDGKFIISGLDLNDTYYLYSSPIKNPDALPGYFANVQNNFCPGTYVGSFFQACGREQDGFPFGINLNSSFSNIDVGVVSINCSLRSNEDYSYEKLQENFSPVTVFDYSVDQKFEKTFVGHFFSSSSYTWSKWDKLMVDLTDYTSGGLYDEYLKLSLVGQKFGNQLEYEMMVFRNGSDTAEAGLTGDTSVIPRRFDLTTFLPLSPIASENIFEIHVRAKRLSNVSALLSFPEFEQFSTNAALPYLLVSSLSESPAPGLMRPLRDTQSNLSDNSSCLDAPFTYRVAKAHVTTPKDPEKQAAAAASCGMIDPQGPKGGGPQHMNLALGFMLAAMAASLMKRSKKFLS